MTSTPPPDFAQGGYITGSPPELARDCLSSLVRLDPDECLISSDDVRAGRRVCSRPEHPTATSDCAPRRGEA